MKQALTWGQGSHFTTIAQCPKCKSKRIHKRKGFHFWNKWRCRKCHKIFLFPNWKTWHYPVGEHPPKYAICKDLDD